MSRLVLSLIATTLLAATHAAEPPPATLPFDPETISRLSLDGKPRSLAIRQGDNTWLGYDLERATIFRTWQAPKGKSGLIKKDFTTKSTGTSWFKDDSDTPWKLQRGDSTLPLQIRYLGCSHRQDHIELRWELRHDTHIINLHERIPLAAAPASDRVLRELRATPLAANESLLPPFDTTWTWSPSSSPAITGTDWHRLTLTKP
ncbi:hypothetical protein FEM03_24120 [Phragmitibacter flavus]|uniref:Uncharacterized protein n=1 Tax=Phragmitibacter flavus TaxID=2576071 RepID=A0A5R8K716_9BACT|nr:hypothetical protein [Phragmitibacter flavus]TLD68163.1 hypothetical protein FEM03_24120 [Phragmitibacter flavus]